MKNKLSWLVGGMLMSCALSAQANVIITPFIGFTGGGQVEDENKNTYDIDPALSYALSIETPFEMGKNRPFLFCTTDRAQRVVELRRYPLFTIPKQYLLSPR